MEETPSEVNEENNNRPRFYQETESELGSSMKEKCFNSKSVKKQF